MKLCAVVTTRNEEETIGPLVSDLLDYAFPVIVVDDCSTDNTVEMAECAGALVGQHKNRVGIGPSLLEAWRKALGFDWENLIQIDAGGSHDPFEIPDFVSVGGHIVIGTRFHWDGLHLGPPHRRIMSRLATAACNMAAATQYTDWTSGYRMFSRLAIRELRPVPYQSKMHAWHIEVLWRAHQMGFNVLEAPITYRGSASSLGLPELWEAFKQWCRLWS